MTKYGYFDDAAREYVVTRPDTPRSWSNYLGSTTYGAIITNNAGGYSFYQSTARGRLTRLFFNSVPMDQPGRYFYLRDRDSGDFWSASWQPVGKPLGEYKSICRHGTGYTCIESDYSDIHTEATYFVPKDRLYECWIMRLVNAGKTDRSLSVFAFSEFTNDWNVSQDTVNLQYTQYITDCCCDGQFISCGHNTHLPDQSFDALNKGGGRHTFFGMLGAPVCGYDTDREIFLGPYRTYANPVAVENGQCAGSDCHGDNPCGALQSDLKLAPGESRELLVVFGVGSADRVREQVLSEMGDAAAARRALAEVRDYWHDRIGSFVAQTEDSALNSMVNVWNAYNSLITFAWSRSASLVYAGERDGLGYRDTVQDILGVLAAIPDEAGSRLELMLTGQFSSGGALPVVKPFEHEPGKVAAIEENEYRADDCLWLFNTVPAYVKETGDLDFYGKILPYADDGSGTVREHLRRALEFNLERRGTHGLPCGLAADWNDCLVLGQRGESVFVAFQLRYGLRTYMDICAMRGESGEEAWARRQLGELDAAIQKHVWDGQWFVRAYREDGEVFGSGKNDEGSLYLNPQSWAVISGAASAEQAHQAMDAVHERLATEYGIALCDPPYAKTPIGEIRAVLFNPSMKENGGIFCHPQSWAVMAEAMLGRGDRAYEYLRAFLPASYNDRADIRQIEPYVHAQSVHGRHSRRFGAARLPWLSGTASWTYYTMTHYILGIRPDYDGLRIDPCIPSAWPGFKVTRRFRGAVYEIHVENPDRVQKGIVSIEIDGAAVSIDAPLPVIAAGSRAQVRVVMGEPETGRSSE